MIGKTVRKIRGYTFIGVVVSEFKKLDGQIRYVVETTHKDFKGMLHIFNSSQIEVVEFMDEVLKMEHEKENR